jgi:hypothetical protein
MSPAPSVVVLLSLSPPHQDASLASQRLPRASAHTSRRLQAPLSPSHRSADCIIATSVAQPELFAVPEPVPTSRCQPSPPSVICVAALRTNLGRLGRERAVLYSNSRISSAIAFIGKSMPSSDGILSKDTRCLSDWEPFAPLIVQIRHRGIAFGQYVGGPPPHLASSSSSRSKVRLVDHSGTRDGPLL